MRTVRPVVTLLLAASLAACASARQPGETGITRLERERAASPQSAAVLRALGVAYYKGGRHAQARETLVEAQRVAPRDGVVALYLGLSAEATGDLTTAKEAYSGYLRYGRTRRVRRQLEARLAAVARAELVASAKQAVAQEVMLSQLPLSATTIAVLPLRFTGSDTSLIPLERGLADLLVTDLSRSAALTVVERDRVQALLDELTLTGGARTDSTTAPRTGRLVRAGRLVQGAITQLDGDQLRVDAALVDVPTSQAVGGVREDDRLEQIFAMEKRIAFGVFDALGVRLTPRERALVEQRPTHSLAAFLAYSRGLMAEDSGQLDEARQFYEAAVRADPRFAPAARRQQQVQAAIVGATVTPAAVESQLAGTTEGTVVAAATQGNSTTSDGSTSSTLNNTANGVNPSPAADASAAQAPAPSKDGAAESTGSDNPTATTTQVIVTVPRPRP